MKIDTGFRIISGRLLKLMEKWKLSKKDEQPKTETDYKEMFLSMFFWVSENRSECLQEAINRIKKMLKEKEKWHK